MATWRCSRMLPRATMRARAKREHPLTMLALLQDTSHRRSSRGEHHHVMCCLYYLASDVITGYEALGKHLRRRTNRRASWEEAGRHSHYCTP